MDEAIRELTTKLQAWFIDFITLLPNLVVALLVLLIFFLLARVVQQGVHRGVRRFTAHGQLNRLAATVSRLLILLAGLALALTILGWGGAVVTMLAGAGVIGLAIGFAFQDIAANFISGILLSIRRPFRLGEIIETNDYLGVVREVNLRSTHIDTFQGQVVVVPNKEVLQHPLVNYSHTGRRRIDLACGVAYGDDLEEAKRIALRTVEEIDYRDTSKEPDLYYSAFGDSSIDFVVRFWVPFAKQTDFLRAQSEAIMRLKKAFDEAGITIPFPIRTLDFGVVGGEKLSDVLPPSLYERSGDGDVSQAQDATPAEGSAAADPSVD